MSLGTNSNTCDDKTPCNASAKTNNAIPSTDKSKIAKPHICPGQRAGQSHVRRYYSLTKSQCSGCSTTYVWARRRQFGHVEWLQMVRSTLLQGTSFRNQGLLEQQGERRLFMTFPIVKSYPNGVSSSTMMFFNAYSNCVHPRF